MDRRTELWVIGACALAAVTFIGVIAYFGGASGGASTFTPTTVSAISSSDWSRGTQDAPVTIIEYGDFECPACGQYEPLIEQLQKDYQGKVLFVFRNFPLTQIHQDAMISSQAAEAAGLQGKYWEMHDMLYAKQAEWSQEPAASVVQKYFNGYAQSLGLDVTKFDSDIGSSVVTSKIQKDVDSGNAAHIDHTPTFFINLVQIPNPNSYAAFKESIDAAIASSSAAH